MLTDREIDDTIEKWKEEDQAAYAKRQHLLKKMSQLRSMNECLSGWAEQVEREWKEEAMNDDKRTKARMAWSKANTGVSPNSVPSLTNLYKTSSTKAGAEALNEKPHWFGTLAVSTKASNLAWNAAKSNECNADFTTPGGQALNSLFSMLISTKKMWKPEIASPAGKTPAFNWSSHDFSIIAEKSDLESKLGFQTSTTSVSDFPLPREYVTDLQCFARAVSNLPSASVNSERVGCCDDANGINEADVSDSLLDTPVSVNVPIAIPASSSSSASLSSRIGKMSLTSSSSSSSLTGGSAVSGSSKTASGWWASSSWTSS